MFLFKFLSFYHSITMESPKVFKILVLLVVSLFTAANAAHILCLMGAATENNQIRSHVLFKALAAKGHILTVVGEANYIKKLHGNETTNIRYKNMDIPSSEIPTEYDTLPYTTFGKLMLWYDRQAIICQEMLSSKMFFNVIRWGINHVGAFDLIIYDMNHAPSCLLSLAQIFSKSKTGPKEVPLIALNFEAKMLYETFELARAGEIDFAAVPYFLSHLSEDMHYLKRICNMILNLYSLFIRYFIVNPSIYDMTFNHIYLQKVGVEFNPKAVMKRVKIILVNTHPVIDYMQPLPPNVIEVAGWHIPEPKELPPVVLAKFKGKTWNGIIFISLGNSFKINDVSEKERVSALLTIIKKYSNYIFFWKAANGAAITKRVPNLYISKFLSENDVLAHSETKLYITVADAMNIQEAIYHGVPVIAIPLLIDQLNVCKRVWERGFGQFFDFNVEHFSELELDVVMKLTLKNLRIYKNTIKRLQYTFRNRSQHPLKTAIWWVEALLANPEGFDDLISRKSGPLNYFLSHSWDIFVPIILSIFTGVLVNLVIFYIFYWEKLVDWYSYIRGYNTEDTPFPIPIPILTQAIEQSLETIQEVSDEDDKKVNDEEEVEEKKKEEDENENEKKTEEEKIMKDEEKKKKEDEKEKKNKDEEEKKKEDEEEKEKEKKDEEEKKKGKKEEVEEEKLQEDGEKKKKEGEEKEEEEKEKEKKDEEEKKKKNEEEKKKEDGEKKKKEGEEEKKEVQQSVVPVDKKAEEKKITKKVIPGEKKKRAKKGKKAKKKK